MWELLIAAIGGMVGFAAILGSYLCLREAQGPFQVISLRLKTVRMRLKVKRIFRDDVHRSKRGAESDGSYGRKDHPHP